MIDLSGTAPFRRGLNRDCYPHPEDPSKCVKVRVRGQRRGRRKLANWLHHRIIDLTGRLDFNAVELRNYRQVREALDGNLPEYFGLQPTSLGPGLVVELVRDDDGTPSITLAEHIRRHGKIADPILWSAFEALFERLRRHHILLYDMNLLNIVLRRDAAGALKPVIVDLKSLNSKRVLLQVSGWSKTQARCKLDRRIARLKRKASRFAA